MYKKVILTGLLFLLILLTACNDSSTKNEIYDHLEKAVSLESAFEKQQDPIMELEEKEQKLYSQIIDLGMDDFDEIKNLAKQAIDTIDKRSSKVELEKKSIQSSKDEYIKVKELISKLDEESVKKKATKMYDAMMSRYDAYEKLNQSYNDSLNFERKLYALLQEKEMDQDKLTNQITIINKSYQKVLDKNKVFNTNTKKYNALKKQFYKAAGIDVEYEKTADADKKKQ